MPKSTEITTLKNMSEIHGIEPKEWRIFELTEGRFELQFVYGIERDGVADLWLPISTRNGKSKNYKSIHAVFSDIKKISRQAVIYYLA